MNPETVTIQGDLSRADVVELCKHCTGKVVVEFGMGGSTLILARCAEFLFSYETNDRWFAITRKRIDQIPDKSARVQLQLLPDCGVPEEIPRCDVLFIDGLWSLRWKWMRMHNDRAKKIIVHDARRYHDAVHALECTLGFFGWVETIECNPGDSNFLVITRREEPAIWADWNKVEAGDNRADWNDPEYAH